MAALLRTWLEFWYEPAPPLNLGICRALFFGALFALYLPHDLSAWGDVSGAFWRPIWLFRRLGTGAMAPEGLHALQLVWKAALLLSACGLATRASTTCSFLLGLYLLGLPHNFGKTHHFDAVVVIILGILSLSRSGDACSLDRAIQTLRDRGKTEGESGEYTWPVRAVWLVLSLFFASGVAKIRGSRLEWVWSDSLAMLAVLLGIRLMLGPAFGQFVICHVFWIPWDTAYAWARRRLTRSAAAQMR